MSVSSLGKFVLPTALISGAIFSSLTLPLILFGSEQITIQLKQEPIFIGRLRDIAAPYLGAAAAIGLVAGAATVGITGWRQSSRKSGQVEAQLADLQQHLQEKETQIEAILMSDPRLQATGLGFFLEETAPIPQLAAPAPAQPLVVSTAAPTLEAQVFPSSPQAVEPEVPPLNAQMATSPLHAAQTFLGYNRSRRVMPQPETPSPVLTPEMATAAAQVQLLHNQMKQIMLQIEGLQQRLQAESEETAGIPSSENASAMLTHLNQRIQKLESQWSVQRIAS